MLVTIGHLINSRKYLLCTSDIVQNPTKILYFKKNTYWALGLKDPFLQGKLPNRTIKYAQKRSRPANIILATVNQAMLRESSKKVTWRSVVEVGAAVVDSGIMTETVAVSARKGDMNVK